MTRDDIVAEARTWLDTPFHPQGRQRGVGVDCIGVVVGVARAFGVPVRDRTGYPMEPYHRELEREVASHCVRVPAASRGDIVLIQWRREPQHVGIECGDTFIHCYSGVGRCIEQPWNNKWRRRVVGCYALPGVTD